MARTPLRRRFLRLGIGKSAANRCFGHPEIGKSAANRCFGHPEIGKSAANRCFGHLEIGKPAANRCFGHPEIGKSAANHPYCTATLVSPKNFVTAGHCILTLVGNQPQSQMRPGQALWISNAVGPPRLSPPGETPDRRTHPWRRVTIVATNTELEQFVAAGNGYAFNVQGGRLVHDLGAVRIAEPQPDRPAVLNFERVRRGDRLTMVGYGCTALKGSPRWGEGMGWKLAGELAVAAEYGRTFTAGGNAVSPNATAGCPGDSGGPVFRKGSVVGVNSSINWDASGRVVQTVFGRIDVGDTTTPYDSRGWLLQTLERFDRL